MQNVKKAFKELIAKKLEFWLLGILLLLQTFAESFVHVLFFSSSSQDKLKKVFKKTLCKKLKKLTKR